MGEEGGRECHRSLTIFKICKEREMQPTHKKMKSSMFDEAYQGDVSKLFNEACQGNVLNLTVVEGKDTPWTWCNRGSWRRARRRKSRTRRICRPLSLRCTGLPSDGQFKSNPKIVIICNQF
jgi:hypothetical protein